MWSRGGIRSGGRSAMIALACAALFVPLLMAQVSSYGDKQMGPANDKPPAILNGVGIAQHLNQQLPLGLTFTDDAGKQVQLASYFGKRPAILALVYYQCPMLCSEELNGLTGALADGELRSRQGLQRDCGEHRSQRGNGSGRGQEAQLSEALWPSGDGRRAGTS